MGQQSMRVEKGGVLHGSRELKSKIHGSRGLEQTSRIRHIFLALKY